MSELLTFAEFHSIQEAQSLIDLLQKSQIQYEVVQEKGLLDKIYIGESLDPMITVKVSEDRFEELNALLLAEASTQLNDINPDYYLFAFTNQELIEVIQNRNEWNAFDQALAKKILNDRKIEIPTNIKLVTDTEYYTPIQLNIIWIISQYILTLWLTFAGIIIALATLFAYKTLKTGERKNMYDQTTRLHAKIMMGLGVIRVIYHYYG